MDSIDVILTEQTQIGPLTNAPVYLNVYRSPNRSTLRTAMTARVYKPAKTAMQSGFANTKAWMLDFEPGSPRQAEPLMGWTSFGDMRQQLRLRFSTREEAVAYCEPPRHSLSGVRN